MADEYKNLPLHGIRVLELTQNVMGPTCGLILADMGAEVIRIEKKDGDDTRRLKGFGRGFYPFYNRNKKSLCIDLKSVKGKDIVKELVKNCDVFMENFAPGTIERLGFGFDVVKKINPRSIFCSMKGFMPGPYEKRAALDEVVQMMSGMAYMTGPTGRPLRAGASIIDVMGGSYAAMGIIIALYEREKTGKGTKVISTLFESAAFLVGQHMANEAITGEFPPPMPERVSSWGVYDLFMSEDMERVFIGITSDRHWKRFCNVFNFQALQDNEYYITNHDRIDHRDTLIPELQHLLQYMSTDKILELAEKANIPYGRVAKPGDLFEDPQMNAGNNLLNTRLPDGTECKLPSLPLRVGEGTYKLRSNPPAMNEGAAEILQSIGLDNTAIETLQKEGIIAKLPTV